jgi:stalled ribosome alternative rescue factor ArfA
MTHEQRKVHHAKRRNRAAALLSQNPSHIRARVERPAKGKGAYIRKPKYREQY